MTSSTQQTVIAGGSADFMTVRHVTVSGDQAQIGQALAREVTSKFGWTPRRVDPTVNRARWTWFERHWPQHFARMNGVARELGIDPGQDDIALDGLESVAFDSGCSAVFCPPSSTVDGRALIGRNYDFFTMSGRELLDTFSGSANSGDYGPAVASRPYVLTTIPDDGLASTVITMNELDSAMDGVNEAGLTVSLLLSDIETVAPPSGTTGPQVGLSVAQLPRFVLDTCENIEQAKQALLGAKQYAAGVPCHYLIGDRTGRAFVWEPGPGGIEHIIEDAAGPLCVTNYPLHRHPDPLDLPEDTEATMGSYGHARVLAEGTKGGSVSAGEVRRLMDEVAIPAGPEYPWRTLWSTYYDLDARTMNARFYLGDGQDGAARYSPELEFSPGR